MRTKMKETKKIVSLDFDGDDKMLNCVTPDGIVARVDVTKISLEQAFQLFDMKDAIDFSVQQNKEKTL